jgi:BirA family biotin operon repressor/biotin-[acetyl-CoA-carboxylase] ligase
VADGGGIWAGRRWPEGWHVRHVAETGSTNDDLLAAVERGSAGHRSALATDHQTAGRGRLDRRWDAPPGANLLVSLAFTAGEGDPAHLVQRVGVAAVDAARTLVDDPGRVGLKWPNDVLLDDAKLAGILAVRSSATGAVVVGIGLNTSWSPPGGADLGGAVDPAAMLERLLGALEVLPDDAGEAYRDRLTTVGRLVRVQLPAAPDLVGRAVGVDGHGRLEVVDGRGVTHVLDVGDVVHVRPAPR